MFNKKTNDIPFVNLHGHTTFSVFDAMGYPEDHFRFAVENGAEAIALTDHGNMNNLGYAVEAIKKIRSEGISLKYIMGIEAYFVPSIQKWREDKVRIEAEKEKKKKVKAEKEGGFSIEDEEASKKEIKDVLSRRAHLILLAQNQTGLNNLFKLISESYKGDNFYKFPRVDFDLLEKYNEGIICINACLGGVLSSFGFWKHYLDGPDAILNAMREIAGRMKSIFGDRWYGEIQWNSIPEQHELNKYMIQVAKELEFEVLSTADSHYPRPELWKDRTIYKKLGWLNRGNIDISLPQTVDEVGYQLYPKNGNQMWESYKKYSEQCNQKYDDDYVLKTIKRTYQVAFERIEDFLPDSTPKFPTFLMDTDDPPSELRTKAAEGLKRIGKDTDAIYSERLEKELKIVIKQGFSEYFLSTQKICEFGQKKYLMGPARGSAGGVLLSYVLGITQIDPIRFDLLFERFMTADQKGFPDIDLDFGNASDLKEDMIAEWGDDRVVPISNFNTLQLRSLIKDVSKFYGVEFMEVNAVTSVMEREAIPKAKEKHGIKAGVYIPTFEEVKEYSETLQAFLKKYPHIATHVDNLYGNIRSLSRHAGGVCLGNDLSYQMPLIKSGGVTQTPWSEGQSVRHLEPLGFIKFDILGLDTLAMFESCIRHILKKEKTDIQFSDIKKYYDEYLHPDVLDLKDQNIWENIFHEGNFVGTFQFTQSTAQNFCKRVKPSSIEELSAITSIQRPGPLSVSADELYLKAKERPDEVEYAHPIVKEILGKNYGLIIYQEDLAWLVHKLGHNVSLEEGNKLRKILIKKDKTSEKQKLEIYKKFVKGCELKSISTNEANKLWKKMEYFSSYGFCRSHAVAYSIISYQCAWLYYNHPAEWCAGFLRKEPEKRKEQALNLVKAAGFNIKLIDINSSGTDWEISEDQSTLIQPLTSIKGLGNQTIEEILKHRPFQKIEDMLFNKDVAYRKLSKRAISTLCLAGALDSIIDNRFTGRKHFWSTIAVDKPKTIKQFEENIKKYAPEGDFTEDEKISHLTELTGFFPIGKIVTEELLKKLEEKYIPPISEYDPDLRICWFIPREILKRKTKNNKTYWVVSVIDSSSQLTKVRCWSVKENSVLHINRPYLAKLDYSDKWGFSSRSIAHNFKLLG
jgi:DNA polymerase III subunit alpha